MHRSTIKLSKFYVLGLLVWLLILLLRTQNIIIPFVNDHLTDLYSVPMFCYTIKIFVNIFIEKKWNPSLRFILSSAMYLTLTFEIICPYISNIYTYDIIDIICYFMGGILYYKISKEKSYNS